MGEFILNMALSVMFVIGMGSWAFRRLTNQSPRVRDAATRAVVGFITRLFR